MDDFKQIEKHVAEAHGATAKGTRKAIGDFLLNGDIRNPVNVKSNNVAKTNYSPNIISGKRLIKWLENKDQNLYFIFVDYQKTSSGLQVIKDSGLIKIENISWDCLTIEAQGWGVIQMCKELKVDLAQSRELFLNRMRTAYEKYLDKEAAKHKKLRELIKNF